MGKRVNTWTVDTEEDLSKAISAGVKIVISDSVKKELCDESPDF